MACRLQFRAVVVDDDAEDDDDDDDDELFRRLSQLQTDTLVSQTCTFAEPEFRFCVNDCHYITELLHLK